MDLSTIRNDVYAIANDDDRRAAIRDLVALVEDLEIEEQAFGPGPVHISVPTRAAVSSMFAGRHGL